MASLEASSVELSEEIKAWHQQTEELKGEEAECSAQIPTLLTSIGLLENTISDYEAVVEAYNESLSETSKVALGREKGELHNFVSTQSRALPHMICFSFGTEGIPRVESIHTPF